MPNRFDQDGTERRLFVHVEEMAIPEQIKDAISDHINDFDNNEIQTMCYWSEDDFILWYDNLEG